VPLEASHDLSTFDCGAPALNEYLKKFALVNHRNQSARTYVARRGDVVVGYYTLAAGSVRREDTPTRIAKGLSRHPVPIIFWPGLRSIALNRGGALARAL